jgi:hypothetical protein
MTFQNDNPLSDFIRFVKRDRPKLRAAIETIMPYDRTPTNLVIRALEYTPVGFAIGGSKLIGGQTNKFRNEFVGAAREDAEKLNLSDKETRKAVEAELTKIWSRAKQEKFAMTMGRATVGSGLFAAGFAMAAAGILAGAMSPDDDDRAETDEFFRRRRAGIDSGSIKIGGTRFTLPKSPPVSVLTAGATFYEQMQRSKKSPTMAASGAAQEAFSDIISDTPLFNSTYNLYRSAKKGKFGEFGGNLASGFVPASAMVRSISDIGDAKERTGSGYKVDDKANDFPAWARQQGRGFRNSFFKGIPGARNFWVDESTAAVPDEERGNAARRFLRTLDPFNTRTDRELEKKK